MIGKRFRSLPFIFANDNYTLRSGLKALHIDKALNMLYNWKMSVSLRRYQSCFSLSHRRT